MHLDIETLYINNFISCLGKSIWSKQYCRGLLLVSLGKLTFQENCILDWIKGEQAVKRKLYIEKIIPSWTESTYANSLPGFSVASRFSCTVTPPRTDLMNVSPHSKCKSERDFNTFLAYPTLHNFSHRTTKFCLKTKEKQPNNSKNKKERITKISVCTNPTSAAACEVILYL